MSVGTTLLAPEEEKSSKGERTGTSLGGLVRADAITGDRGLEALLATCEKHNQPKSGAQEGGKLTRLNRRVKLRALLLGREVGQD